VNPWGDFHMPKHPPLSRIQDIAFPNISAIHIQCNCTWCSRFDHYSAEGLTPLQRVERLHIMEGQCEGVRQEGGAEGDAEHRLIAPPSRKVIAGKSVS
jgi:hypothetical protein